MANQQALSNISGLAGPSFPFLVSNEPLRKRIALPTTVNFKVFKDSEMMKEDFLVVSSNYF